MCFWGSFFSNGLLQCLKCLHKYLHFVVKTPLLILFAYYGKTHCCSLMLESCRFQGLCFQSLIYFTLSKSEQS